MLWLFTIKEGVTMKTKTLLFLFIFLCLGSIEKISNAQTFSNELEEKIKQSPQGDFIRAVVKLKGRLDINELKLATSGKVNTQRREIVKKRMKDFSNQSQTNLLTYLSTIKANGDLRSIKSLAITNKIVIEANKSGLDKLRYRSDIEYIYIEHPQMVLCANTWSVEKINAHLSWSSFGVDGTGVKIGVLDSGTDYNHTDLHLNIWNNLGEDADGDGHTLELNGGGQWVLDPGDIDTVDNDGNGYDDGLVGWNFAYDNNNPMDNYGHGTHVTGIAAGDGSAGTQTGVAPGAIIISLKVTENGQILQAVLEEAITYAIENNLNVINLSLGWVYNLMYTPGSIYDPRADLRLACETAIAAGMVVCVAAGNDGEYANQLDWRYGTPIDYRIPHNVRTPGDVPSVITVGATDASDVISYLSSNGPTTWSDVPEYGDYPYPSGLMKPDVSAPGEGVTSTKRGGGYEVRTGTSMATPAVSGSVALLLQTNPLLTSPQIKYILEMSAIDLGASGKDGLYGSGRIDVNKAVKYALEHYGGKIIQNLTIPSSETWTFSPGVTVTIQSGASIIVNGILIANGTSTSKVTFDFISPNSTTQNGIKFISGSNGTINNAIIRNGYYGVSVTGNPTGAINITNSAISNSSYAIYINGNTSSNVNITGCDIGTSSGGINLNSAVANIDGCTIHNITTYGGGAVTFNNSGGTIKNCSIQNNSGSANGISILNNSSPYVFQNTIANNTLNGVYVYHASPSLQSNVISTTGYAHAAVSNNSYSYTLFGKTSYPFDGYNTISNSFYGIYVSDHSIIQAGYTDIARYNRIINNSYRNTYVIGYSTLYAKNDWWGAYQPDTTKFYKETGSYFYYLPYLTEDPSGSQNIVSSRGLIAEANVAATTVSYSPEEELLLKAKELQEKNQTNEAIGIYKELINTYEEKSISEIALVELSNIYRQTKDKNEKDYLGNFKLSKNNKKRLYPIALELLSHINKEEGNLTEALIDCETLIKEFPSTEHEKNALMNKFFLYYDSKDISSAKTVVEKLTNSFSASPEIAAASNLLEMEELGKEYFPPKVNAEDNSKKDSLVENYEINNYPNPFNPVTTINYQLPKSGSVTLKIFDILGNEIRTLVNEQKEMGKYTIQFYASSLASGMYVYQLRVNDYTSTKKMLLVK